MHIFRYSIQSLLRQTIKPDLFLINLSDKAFNSFADFYQYIPDSIDHAQIKINFVEDVGPHTKLLPALDYAAENDLIVTVDDDVIYSERLLEDLLRITREKSDTICCTRARLISRGRRGQFLNYNSWPNIKSPAEALNILPLGVGGVAYRKKFFDMAFLIDEAFKMLAPNADDLWFRAASLIPKTPVYVEPGLDSYNMPIRHKLGLDQINLKRVSENNEATAIHKWIQMALRRKWNDDDSLVNKNDIQWRSIQAYAREQGKEISF
ncbi:hypothetical protein G3480_20315 [Thiorhodococcus mannitoliphagus]|uniref:Glycosyltransferase family 2 protein n=1 Tax=Thiorhodococcus mannitoliphagus TaxID=329406 RepID=A0A6P1E014_9GAMM|nr:hypothetical protein [Thiorhodococcus mannitoliphagus]NEX22621.1 hypothetical protein [Thiorhodococcus mannitoliphagus]